MNTKVTDLIDRNVSEDKKAFDQTVKRRMENIKEELNSEVSDEINRLQVHFSERLKNLEKRKNVPSLNHKLQTLRNLQTTQEHVLRLEFDERIEKLKTDVADIVSIRDTTDKSSRLNKLSRSKSTTSLIDTDSCYESFISETRDSATTSPDDSNTCIKQNFMSEASSECQRCQKKMILDLDNEILNAKMWLFHRNQAMKNKL